jgi:hypothetical protein
LLGSGFSLAKAAALTTIALTMVTGGSGAKRLYETRALFTARRSFTYEEDRLALVRGNGTLRLRSRLWQQRQGQLEWQRRERRLVEWRGWQLQ